MLLVGVALFSTRAFGAVSPVGVFSSVRSTQEHAYGYSVQLWKDDGRLFGLFSAFDGPVGDAPVGLIDDVQYNSKDGNLHFQAKLTTGVVYLGPGNQRPSEDLFVFTGTLRNDVISGVVQHFDKLHPTVPPVTETVRMTSLKQASMIQAREYNEWKKYADDILRVRGPRW